MTIPGSSSDDIVIIGDQDIIEYNANDGTTNDLTIGSLTIGGSESGALRFPYSNYNPGGNINDLNGTYSLTVTGDVSIAANGSLIGEEGGSGTPAMLGAANNRTHTLNIGGNLAVGNVFDLQGTNTSRIVNLQFNSTDDQTISESGTPTVDIYNVTYNLQDAVDQVIVTSATFSNAIDRESTFTSGTFVHNNSGSYNNTRNNGQTWTMNFIIQDGSFTLTSPTTDRTITISGDLTISGGGIVNTGNNGVGSGVATDLNISGALTMTGSSILNVGDGDGTVSNLPTDGDLDINGTASGSSVNNSSVFAFNTDLAADVDLIVENGALFSTGSGIAGDFDLLGGAGVGSNLTINDATTTFTVRNDLQLAQDASVIINAGDINIGEAETTDNSNNLELNSGSSVTINGGTVDVGNEAVGEGRLRLNQTVAETVTLTVSGASTVLNIYDHFSRNDNGSINNITISNGATVNVGLGSTTSNTQSSIDGGTVAISGTGSSLNVGGGLTTGALSVSDNATISAGTLAGAGISETEGTVTMAGSGILLFESGLRIEGGGSLSTNTVNVFHSGTNITGTIFQITDDFSMDGGILNVGASATSTNPDVMEIQGTSIFSFNDGVMNVCASLTDEANWTGGDLIDIQGTTSQFVVGDGDANTADLNVGENLVALASVVNNRSALTITADDAQFRVLSDGDVQLGGGNVGRLNIDDDDAVLDLDTHFQLDGGTVNIAHELVVQSGTGVTINSGTLNIGLTSGDGSGTIEFPANPNGQSFFNMVGGTVNVGDGSALLDMGNENNNPPFGDVDEYQQFSLTGGTFSLNGRFAMDDRNARFEFGDAVFNVNPRSSEEVTGDVDIFSLFEGIFINSTSAGGTINILNPHGEAGGGYALEVSDQGTNGDRISSSTSGSFPVDFSGVTFNFGDGSENADGSSDGFDLFLSSDHTYGDLTVNNPSGSNRQVQLAQSGLAYQMSGDLTITAGNFDINDNTLDRNSVGGTLTIGSAGELTIGNSDGAANFPGSNTSFTTYTLDGASTVIYDGSGNQNVDIPGTAEFGNLTILGSGTKDLTAGETVNGTLLLTAATFDGNDNLSLATDANITIDNGNLIVTTAIQSSNEYTVEYIGTAKNTTSNEFSGGGSNNKNLIMNLDSESEVLTLNHASQTVLDATFTEGTLETGSNDLSIYGNFVHNASHSGSGQIIFVDGATAHTLSGNNTGILQNITINSVNQVDVSTDLEVRGTFTLTNGIFNIGDNLLNLSQTAADFSGGSSSTYVQQSGSVSASGVTKTFSGTTGSPSSWPVGIGGGLYTPATVDIDAATSGGTITIKAIDGAQPLTTDASDLELAYYWSVSNTGLGSPTATLTFNYDQSDVNGSESSYIPARYASAAWTTVNDVTEVNTSTNVISFTDVNYIDGDFTAGEPSEFGIVLTYYSRADGNWNDPNSWSTTGLGGASAGTIPGSSSPAIIGDNNTITITDNNTTVTTLEIQSTGTLVIDDGTTGHNLGTVTGSGELELESNSTTTPEFPGGTFTSFLSVSGGTVDFSGSGSYTIPSSNTAFNNVIISGTGVKTLPDADLTLQGDFGVIDATTALISDATNGDLTIGGNLTISDASGILRFPATNVRTVSVTDSVKISNATATLDVVTGGTASHSLLIGASLSNSGIFDLNVDDGATVITTFTGSSNESVEGSGTTTDFHRLIVNKGSSNTSILDVTSTNISFAFDAGQASKPIEIQNGTFRLSSANTITLSTGGDFSIPATGGLSVNNSSAVFELTTGEGDIRLLGSLELVDGTINIGDDATGLTDNDLIYEGTASQLDIQNGTLNVSGKFQPTSTTNAPPDAITYSQSGGLFRVSRYRATSDLGGDGNSDFSIENTASSFTLSSGTIEIVRGVNGGDGKAVSLDGGMTNNVTGGTIQIITAATSGVSSDDDVAFTIGFPIYDFVIGAGTGYVGDVGSSRTERDLTVLNDFTVNIGGNLRFYRVNGNSGQDRISVNLGGNLLVTNGTLVQGNDETFTFDGSGNTQTITDANGSTLPFENLVINNSGGTVQLGASTNLAIRDDWTLTAGTFDGATNTGTVAFSGTVAQSIIGLPTTFYDVELNNSTGLTLSASSATISNNLTLTDGIFSLGSNALSLSSTSVGIIGGTPSATAMIITDGLSGSPGISKNYPDALSDFTFPIGTGSIYTPVRANQTTANGTGILTINPVASEHPNSVGATSALDYFWEVSTSGFGGGTVIAHTYNYDQSDVGGDTEANYNAASFSGTNWTEDTDNVDEGLNEITFSTTGSISDDFTAGEALLDPTVYYSRNATSGGNWSALTTWSTTDHTGAAAASLPGTASPVIIASGHTVTIQDGTVATSGRTEITGELIAIEEDISSVLRILGTGTLNFQPATATTPTLPGIQSSFINAGGGTITYGGANDYDIPVQTSYNNLVFDGSGTISASTNSTINGNLSISQGNVDFDAFTMDRASGGGVFSMASGTRLDLNGDDNFPNNFTTITLDAASTVRYIAGNAQTIAAVSYGNLYMERAGGSNRIKNLEGNTIVLGDLTIERGADFYANDFDLEVGGDWDRDTRNGSEFVPGTGTVTFNGSSAQALTYNNTGGSEDEVFHNLMINNSSGFSFPTQMTSLSIGGNLTITAGALDFNNEDFSLTGDLTVDGSITNAGTATLNNTSADQTINGTASTTLGSITLDKMGNNLIVSNDAGGLTVTGTLILSDDGLIQLMGTNNDLIIGNGGSISSGAGDFSATRMIQLTGSEGSSVLVMTGTDNSPNDYDFTFPIGVGSFYTPVITDISAITDAADGTIGITLVEGNSTIGSAGLEGDATEAIDFFTIMELTDISSITGSFTYTYDDSDIQGSESNYQVRYYNGSSWQDPDDVGNGTGTVTSANNQSQNQYGGSASTVVTASTTEWITGTNDAFYPRLYSTNPSGGFWSSATAWTVNSDGSDDAQGITPTENNSTFILAGHTITTDANDQETFSLDIASTATLDMTANTTGHTFGVMTGSGTLLLGDDGGSGSNFPSFTSSGSNFFGSSGGTVEYQSGTLTLSTNTNTYNNLIIGGTAASVKTLGNNITVFNDLTINTNITLDSDNTNNYDLTIGGDFTINGTYLPRNGTLTLNGSGAQSLPTGLTYFNLVFDNTGVKTISAPLTINNDFTILPASGTVSAGSNAIDVSGNFTGTNAFSHTGTVTLSNTGADQTIAGSSTIPFNELFLDKSDFDVNLTANISLANDLTIDDADLLGTGNISSQGNWILNNSSSYTGTGTITFNGDGTASQSINSGTVGTVTFQSLVIDITSTGGSNDNFDFDGVTMNGSGDLNVNDGTLQNNGADRPIDVVNLTIGANGTLDATSMTAISVSGDWSISGTFTNTGTTVDFDGATAQNLTGTTNFVNLTKSGGGDLTLNDDANVSGTLTMTSGDIVSTSLNLLTLAAGASVSGGSGSSHVVQTMANTVASTSSTVIDFPIGDGTNYRPISYTLEQSDATSRVYTAQVIDGAPTTRTLPMDITHVSLIRHYNVTQSPSAALTSGTVRITFGVDDDVVVSNDLLIVKDDGGGNWVDLGGSLIAGDANNGTIESTINFTSFSDFVLASDGAAPLPVQLLSFEGKWVDGSTEVTWTTINEINNSHFQLLKSTDGITFDVFEQVTGGGDTNERMRYRVLDNQPSNGLNFYQLKQFDFDGTESDLGTISVGGPGAIEEIGIGPNPGQRLIWIYNQDLAGKVTIFDLEGRIVMFGSLSPGNTPIEVSNLPPAIYQVVVETALGRNVFKMIKQ